METHEVVIIGAGPAGISTALQLKRYGIDFSLLERSDVGGLLHNANLVENYPGFPQGVSGPALVRRLVDHLQSADIKVTFAEVTTVSRPADMYILSTSHGEFQARVLVIATGTKPKEFTEFLIPANLRQLVYYEVYPLLNVTGKQIAIVGAGDAAFDYALNLSRQNQVLLLNRGSQISCLPLLWQRATASPHIAYHPNTHLVRIEGLKAGRMTLHCDRPDGNVLIEADYLIGALGREPRLGFLPPSWAEASPALEEQGVLYWIGDVRNGLFRQTAIAAGDGILAAMKIYRYLKETSR